MMHDWRIIGAASLLLAAPAVPAAAQSAVFAGDVARDTLNHHIPGATVAIPALNRSVVTDANGEFKMSGLPSGHYAATIRRLGFIAMTDTFDLVNGSSVEREYVMDPSPTVLDSVVTSAMRQPKFVPPGLSEFEERRKTSIGGYFVTDSVLRQNDSRKLNDLLTARIPSLTTFRPYPQTEPNVEYLSSGRGDTPGPAFSGAGAGNSCPVTLYLNGSLFYSAASKMDVPDIAQFQILDLEAVEYYPGGASLPEKYNATGAGCGVLLLWTKEE